MSVIRVGSNGTYAEGWEQVFGGVRSARKAGKKAAGKAAKKSGKKSGKKSAKKPARPVGKAKKKPSGRKGAGTRR